MEIQPTGTITFLFTDVEGSTRLWEKSPEAMKIAHVRHAEIIAQCVAAQGGNLVRERGEGDSTFSVFTHASQAFAAALNFQRGLHTESWPDGAAIRVRAALHTGVAEEWRRDYNSSDVNRCARLRAIAHGGQTLLSRAAYELVQDALPDGASLKDMGMHRLKDLERPEHVFQLLHADIPGDFPPLQSLNARLTNLPTQMTKFVGREKEIQELKSLLQTERLVTLTGSGGCGKTRLASQVAAEIMDEFPHGAWIIDDLAALTDAALVPRAVMTALTLGEEPGREIMDTLTDYLRHRNLLLLMDNCERLAEPCARLALDLLQNCPNLKILATSQAALNAPGERAYRIPSLERPAPGAIPTEDENFAATLMNYDAVRLFMERTRAYKADFVLTRQNAVSVLRVCDRLDGIPSALELAAARMRTLTIEQIASRLEDRFSLLTGGPSGIPARHQTLRATLDWSYDLLTKPERALFQRLSIFVGGATLETVEAICADGKKGASKILDELTSLVDKSLVKYEEADNKSRFSLSETNRLYAAEQLGKRGQNALTERHAHHFGKFAEDAASRLKGPEQLQWLDALDAEHDNLRAAFDNLLRLENSDGALNLAASLAWFWRVRGYLQEGRLRVERALAATDSSADSPVRAKALNGAGGLAHSQGDYIAARVYYEICLHLRHRLADDVGIAASLSNLGALNAQQGDYAGARQLYTESLVLRRKVGDQWGIATSLDNLGLISCSLGELQDARDLHEQSLGIRRQLGDGRGIAISLTNLGLLAWRQQEMNAAQDFWSEGHNLFEKLNDKAGVASTARNLAILARDQQNYAAAYRYYRGSLKIAAEFGDLVGIATLLNDFADMAFIQHRWKRTVRLWSAAQALRATNDISADPEIFEEYESDVRSVRNVVGEGPFEFIWKETQLWSLEATLRYAEGEADE